MGCHRLDQRRDRLDEPGEDEPDPLLLLHRLPRPQLLKGGGVLREVGEIEAGHRLLDAVGDGAEALDHKVVGVGGKP